MDMLTIKDISINPNHIVWIEDSNGENRTIIHLVGGKTLDVKENMESVLERLSKIGY